MIELEEMLIRYSNAYYQGNELISDEDYDSAKESNNGYSAEDLICVNAPKRRDENHDNSL